MQEEQVIQKPDENEVEVELKEEKIEVSSEVNIMQKENMILIDELDRVKDTKKDLKDEVDSMILETENISKSYEDLQKKTKFFVSDDMYEYGWFVFDPFAFPCNRRLVKDMPLLFKGVRESDWTAFLRRKTARATSTSTW